MLAANGELISAFGHLVMVLNSFDNFCLFPQSEGKLLVFINHSTSLNHSITQSAIIRTRLCYGSLSILPYLHSFPSDPGNEVGG